jgi:hypothetical protein
MKPAGAVALFVGGLRSPPAASRPPTAPPVGRSLGTYKSGAGGISCNEQDQPTTPFELLIETPRLRVLLGQTPRGLVVVDATLRPRR